MQMYYDNPEGTTQNWANCGFSITGSVKTCDDSVSSCSEPWRVLQWPGTYIFNYAQATDVWGNDRMYLSNGNVTEGGVIVGSHSLVFSDVVVQ